MTSYERIAASGLGWVPAPDLGEGVQRYVGECLTVQLPAGTIMPSPEAFARRIFTPYDPWRLMGIVHRIRPDRVDVEAIDWPTETSFGVEIFGDVMRVYFPRGGQPEAMFRLVHNLKRHVDRDTLLLAGNGDRLL